MPRFVVLFHEVPSHHERDSHWDFMLEDRSSLLTWALPESPFDNDRVCNVLELPPHVLHYLTKEGPISRDRGIVKRVDEGEYELLPAEGNTLVIRIHGNRLNGIVRISHDPDSEWCWALERFEQ
jgi:hypothetical protein